MSEKILVSKFVEDFKKLSNDTDRQVMVSEHVVRHYAPILNKKNVLDIMMDGCVKTGKSGRYIDLLVSKLNFIGATLILYTDLAIDKKVISDSDGKDKEVADMWATYDLLKESGVLEIILNEIGSDIEELLFIQEQLLGTWHNENASTTAYISDMVEKISLIFSTALGKEISSLADALNTGTDEDKAELVMSLMEKFRVK
jgi:hypothetical protein